MTFPKTSPNPGEAAREDHIATLLFRREEAVEYDERQLVAAIDAAVAALKPQQPPPTSTQTEDEREHCEPTGPLVTAEELHCGKALYFVGPKHRKAVNVLVRERAAVRAACQAEIERLRAVEKSLNDCVASLERAPRGGPLLSESTLVVLLKRIARGE